MKILFIHTYYRYRGGEEVLVETEMSILKNAGFEVELLAFRNPAGFLASTFLMFMLPFNFISFIKTKNKIRKFKPDVVHLHNWHFAASPSVIVACNQLKVPIVLSLHNFRLICPSATLFHNGNLFLESVKTEFPWKAIRLGVYRKSVVQTFLLAFTIYLHKKLKTWHKVRAFLINSEFEKKTFLESSLGVAEDKYVIKVNSIADPSFDPEIKRQNHFAYIGRLVSEKGIEMLIEVFAKSGLPLVIFGYGPLEQIVKQAAENYPNIQFKGSLTHSKLYEELRICNALIFPSTWFEGMPLTLLHAFSTGTPVIASNIGAMSTMIQDQKNGLHFKVGDVDDLLLKLEYWNNLSTAEKEGFGQRARELYQNVYTHKAILESLESIYSKVQSQER